MPSQSTYSTQKVYTNRRKGHIALTILPIILCGCKFLLVISHRLCMCRHIQTHNMHTDIVYFNDNKTLLGAGELASRSLVALLKDRF